MFTQIYTNQLTYKNEGTHIGGNEIYFRLFHEKYMGENTSWRQLPFPVLIFN